MMITLIAEDLAVHSLTRVYCLYSILRKHYDVEVIGRCSGKRPYPIFDETFQPRLYPCGFYPRFFKSIKEMVKDISGDVIIPDNYNFPSFGVALIKKITSHKPVLLGLSDYQRGIYSPWSQQSKKELILDPNSLLYTVMMEKFITYADEILVTSRFLQKKFGGVYLPHGRDTEFLDPDKADGAYLKKKYNLEDKKVIMYLGKPTRHANLDDIINALSILNINDICFVIVGGNPHREIEQRLIKKGSRWLKIIPGLHPWEEIPNFLDFADLVVLPQIKTTFTQAYTPAKMFDAMAMAKPIISTRVSDMPEILEGCGIIVDPGDVHTLAENIEKVLSNPQEASIMGKKARQRCIERYSWKAMEKTLLKVLRKYETSK